MRHVAALLALLVLAACQTDSRTQVLATDATQVQLRAIQTRAFATGDVTATVRSAIATLQDLGFVVDKADPQLGIVSGTKLTGRAVRLTVVVRPLDPARVAVRANAQEGQEAVSDPRPYQAFFDALAKAMFLEAQGVD
jgi:hypothetical protein